jgi:hypothetical protein
MSAEYATITRMVDVLLFEQAKLITRGPRLTITHRFWVPGTLCKEGEEVFSVSVASYSGDVPIPVSLRPRLLLDYLARHQGVAQSASQIAAGIGSHPFYRLYGGNVGKGIFPTRRLSRTTVKEQVLRLRQAMAAGFSKAGLAISPERVIVSQKAETNEVLYRLKAAVTWRHVEY